MKKLSIVIIGLLMLLSLLSCTQKPATTQTKSPTTDLERQSTKSAEPKAAEPTTNQPSTQSPVIKSAAVVKITPAPQQYYIKFKFDGAEKIMTDNFYSYYDPANAPSGFKGYYMTLISGNDDKSNMFTITFPGKIAGEYNSKTNYIDGQSDYAPGFYWSVQGVGYQNNTDSDSVKINITRYDADVIKGSFEGTFTKVGPTGYLPNEKHVITDGEIFIPFGK
jgi:hypothetical protein